MSKWETRKLEELALVERGRFLARPRNDPQYYGGNIPFIQTGDVANANGSVNFYSQTLNEKGLTVSKLFPKDSLVISIAANIGDVARVNFDFACPDSLVVIQARQRTNSAWLKYLLESKKSYFESQATQNAQANINLQTIKPLKINVPSYEEQKIISATLQTWDTAIEKTEALITAKGKQFKWLLKTLISDQRDNPEWRKVKLEDACEKIVGGGTPSTANSDYWQGHIPWITSADIVSYKTIKCRKYITEQALNNSATNLIPKNNIIVVTRVSLGKAVKNDIDICISQDSQGLILKKFVYPDFLINFLIEKIKILKSESQGSTIKGITKRQLADIKIPLPPLPEQKVIASLLEKAQEEIDLLKQLAEQYRTQKRGLMQKLLTGEWRVKTNG